MGSVVDRVWLKTRLPELRREGARVVFTNGCFDLLHRGHLECLKSAKSLGNLLVVGVNSDASVRRLKGEGRPYVKEQDRAALVSGLECVDYTCTFSEDTPLELIMELRPDVLVKGGDYKLSEVVGAKEVIAWGGEVRLVEYLAGVSTSEIVRRIRGGQARAEGGDDRGKEP
jgi:rfaE bifunctional protein nucleotidyltransferase chain/domain